MDWATIRQSNAPFIPDIKSITDTSYFPDTGEGGIDDLTMMSGMETLGREVKRDLAFVGYTFKRWETIRKQI